MSASLSGIDAGAYPSGVAASFAGDSGYATSGGSNSLTIAKADQTITFGALAARTYGDAAFTVSATASSALSVSFGATGNCTIATATVTLTGAGSCTITASQAGDTNYNAAPDVPQTFSIAKADQMITFNPLADKTASDPSFTFGNPTDVPVVGDWNFDGKADVGVRRGSSFLLDLTGNRAFEPARDLNFSYGNSTDKHRYL